MLFQRATSGKLLCSTQIQHFGCSCFVTHEQIDPSLAPKKSSRLRTFFRRLFICIALLLLVFIVFNIFENWRGQRAWKLYVAEANARGERLGFAETVPTKPRDEDNFGALPFWLPLFETEPRKNWIDPLRHLDEEGMKRLQNINPYGTNTPPDDGDWREGKLIDLKTWQNFYLTQSDFPVADPTRKPAEAVLTALSKFDKELRILRDASARPRNVFPIRYEDNVAALLPHLSVLRNLARIAVLRSQAELALNRSIDARNDLLLSLRLSEAISEEPLLISMLVRIAIIEGSMQPLWEGLAQHSWTDADLASIDVALAKINMLAEHQQALRGERTIFSFGAMELLRREPKMLNTLVIGGGSEPFLSLAWIMPTGWIDQNKTTISRLFDSSLATVDPVARRVFPAISEQLENDFKVSHSKFNPHRVMANLLFPAINKTNRRAAFSQQTIDHGRIACALERYRLRHNRYPDSLDSLTTDYLKTIPRDIITGEPLHYQLIEPSRYTLRATGWNGVDDQGKQLPEKSRRANSSDAPDWVWPFPAANY